VRKRRQAAAQRIGTVFTAILASAMNVTLSPYLNFDGKTAEAMRFYQSVLGGDLNIQTFADAGMAQNDTEKNLTLHAALTSNGITLFGSDGRPDQKVIFGDNVHLSLQGGDSEKVTSYFNGLAAGGHVDMPLAKQFWGDTFGMLTDKFGVHWMVNITA
jgi:PhnB protein